MKTNEKPYREDSNEIDKRINTIYGMLLAGFRTNEIIKETVEFKWGLSSRQIQNYIAKAKAYIDEEAKVSRQYEFNKALARYENLYGKALKTRDIKTAAKIIEQKSKMLNLYDYQDNSNNSINITHNFIINGNKTDTLEPDDEFDN